MQWLWTNWITCNKTADQVHAVINKTKYVLIIVFSRRIIHSNIPKWSYKCVKLFSFTDFQLYQQPQTSLRCWRAQLFLSMKHMRDHIFLVHIICDSVCFERFEFWKKKGNRLHLHIERLHWIRIVCAHCDVIRCFLLLILLMCVTWMNWQLKRHIMRFGCLFNVFHDKLSSQLSVVNNNCFGVNFE